MDYIEGEASSTREQHMRQRVRRMQVTFVLLALITSILKNLDRATLSIAAIHIRADLGLSATQIGALLSMWSIAYAVFNIPAGYFIDRLGVRKLASVAIFLWSIAQLAGGCVSGFTQLLISRFLLGITEAPNAPANAKAIATWIPIKNRGLALAVYTSGGSVGAFIAPLLLTPLMLHFGWRYMFVAMGVVGIFLAVIYFAVYRDVDEANLSDDERALISEGEPPQSSSVPISFGHWKALYFFKTTWALMIGTLTLGWIIWLYVGWLPLYLETEFHMTVGKTGIYASIPFGCGILGSFLGGLWTDRLERRGATRLVSCKTPIVIGMCALAIATFGVAFSKNAVVALVFGSCAVCLCSVVATAVWAAGSVLYPKRIVASAITSINFASYIGATISPLITGWSVDATGSFKTSFIIGGVVTAFGAFLMFQYLNSSIDEKEIEAVVTGIRV
ncbi:MFS transporter [Paraburkholderia sp. Cy-641]|uniref:MFS transporter n=1 Tax=Paraburkholderia sp. Cy-641 TaxID=2608337 RepID=UPI0014217465|nr:MFS transporter [Paraburkholderia sp. Cy-641]NIF80459.1 MFS transporter [Paraburkholderia sp. Cy-641]